MEQTISTYVSRHPAGGVFEIGYVECRTLRCEIKLFGHDESIGPTWERVKFDLLQQPWASFGESGTSSGRIEERFVIHQYFCRLDEGRLLEQVSASRCAPG